MKLVPPQRAAELIREGAVLVDIREAHEHAGERIPGAVHCPLSTIGTAAPVAAAGQAVVFHCKMGNRTMINADKLVLLAPSGAFVLEGGIEAWKNAGLPVEKGT